MRAKTQKPIIFNNTCNCIVDESLLEKSILWYQNSITNRLKKIYLFGKYPAVTIGKDKLHVHRLIYQFSIGRKLDRNEYVHHVNRNKLDSTLCNLELIDSSTHQSIHNKGKIISIDHKRKISNSNKTRVHRLNRNYLDDNKIIEMYNSGYNISQISKELNAPWSTINYRVNKIIK